jgi:hypothetical protein
VNRIVVVNGPYDIDHVDYELDPALLVTTDIAMYVADGKIYVTRVLPTTLINVYTHIGNAIVLGSTDRESAISEVYELLTNMTGFDFLTRYLLTTDTDIDFDFCR